MRIFLLSLMIVAVGAQAQAYEARSEFMYCKLKDGKTIQDVIEQSQ